MSYTVASNGNCQMDSNKRLDPNTISKDFCDFYYPAMATKGFMGVSHVFNVYSSCNYNGTEYTGIQNVAVAVSSEGIMRLAYDKLTHSCSVIDNNTMIIQVAGLCQGITFWNQVTPTYSFTETFVLKYENGPIFVNNYFFKLF